MQVEHANIRDTYIAAAAIRRGYAVVCTGAPGGTGTAVETVAALTADGVAMETVATGQPVAICVWGVTPGVVDGAGAVDRGDLVAQDATGTWVAAGANNAVARVRIGAAAGGMAELHYFGHEIADPS